MSEVLGRMTRRAALVGHIFMKLSFVNVFVASDARVFARFYGENKLRLCMRRFGVEQLFCRRVTFFTLGIGVGAIKHEMSRRVVKSLALFKVFGRMAFRARTLSSGLGKLVQMHIFVAVDAEFFLWRREVHHLFFAAPMTFLAGQVLVLARQSKASLRVIEAFAAFRAIVPSRIDVTFCTLLAQELF